MLKSERTVRYTTEQLDAMARRGESQTDWARVDAMTDEELEASIDFDEEGRFDLDTGYMISIPEAKKQITLRLDPDVIEFFKAAGPGYQTRMNAVLRQYVVAHAK